MSAPKYSKMRHALESASGALVGLIESDNLSPYLEFEVTNKETGATEYLTVMDIVELATNAMAEEDGQPAPDPLADHPSLFEP